MSQTRSSASIATGGHEHLKTVRYSLPELLAELKDERLSGSLGSEKLQQPEIGKLFETEPRRRRAKSAR